MNNKSTEERGYGADKYGARKDRRDYSEIIRTKSLDYTYKSTTFARPSERGVMPGFMPGVMRGDLHNDLNSRSVPIYKQYMITSILLASSLSLSYHMSVRISNNSYLKSYNEGNNDSPNKLPVISIEPIEPGH